MKKVLKLIMGACFALVVCFTLASCNKGTCDLCHKKDVDRHKVKIADIDAGFGMGSQFSKKTYYYCDDCYELYKKTN